MRAIYPWIFLVCLTPSPSCQKYEGLLPFRKPTKHVEVPKDVYYNLQIMLRRADAANARLHFDAEGREVCDDPEWHKARERLRGKMHNMGGYLGIILRDSDNPASRRVAAYGSFYLDRVDHTIELIAFFPGEPERRTREESYRRAIPFLRAHLTERSGESPVSKMLYTLNTYGYFGLLDLKEAHDQAQGLWFLAECMQIRPDIVAPTLEEAGARLPALLISENEDVRNRARAFVQTADPKKRPVPGAKAKADDVLSWYRQVRDLVLPPIRRISAGRIDLHASPQLDEVVSVGSEMLRRKAIGVPASGKLRSGLFYRGFRVARLPTPLDRLGLPLDVVVTAINGRPVVTGKDILSVLRSELNHRTSLMVEYVKGRKSEAIEYRLRLP